MTIFDFERLSQAVDSVKGMSCLLLTCVPANPNRQSEVDDKNTLMCRNGLPLEDRVVQMANSNHYECEC
jgi:hypothetical protein